MNFRIITLLDTQTEICLHRDRNEDMEEIVRITAFVTSSSGDEPKLEKIVRFPDPNAARSFIDDFSEVSATSFLEDCLEGAGLYSYKTFGCCPA